MTDITRLVDRVGLAPHVPAAIALVDSTGRVQEAAWGAWSDGRVVSSTDRFYMASLAKQVTGAAAAVLVQEGRLDPDMAIGRYLADLPSLVGQITPRQLLHHTAGLPAAGEIEVPGENWTEVVALTALRRLSHLVFEPGTAHMYSNLGYVLLARVVTECAGCSFSSFASSCLFEPLGLKNIGFPVGSISDFPQTAQMGPGLPLTVGDGGLWSTAGDFSLWLHHQNRDTLGIADLVTAHGTLLNGEAVNYGWGLGLRIRDGEPIFIHGGEWLGATSKSVRGPSSGIAITAVSSGASVADLNILMEAALEEWASLP